MAIIAIEVESETIPKLSNGGTFTVTLQGPTVRLHRFVVDPVNCVQFLTIFLNEHYILPETSRGFVSDSP